MHVAPNVVPLTMLDHFVLGVAVCYALVGLPFVGIDGFNISGDVLTDEAVQGLVVASPNHWKADVSAALQGTYNHDLVAFISAPHSLDLATYESFVSLYDALQELCVNLVQGGTDSMAQIPSGLVAHAKSTLELVRTNTLFRL
jgi:hypothetical protein